MGLRFVAEIWFVYAFQNHFNDFLHEFVIPRLNAQRTFFIAVLLCNILPSCRFRLACFDSFDHHVIINILQRRIDDEAFIQLIWKFLKAGYMEQWAYNRTYSGVPQGSGVSPILACFFQKLFNVRFDCFGILFAPNDTNQKIICISRVLTAIKIKINENGKERFVALHRGKLVNQSDIEILARYNAEVRGLYNYYSIANDAFTALGSLHFSIYCLFQCLVS